MDVNVCVCVCVRERVWVNELTVVVYSEEQ